MAIKAILIDPFERALTEIEIEGDLQSIYDAIEAPIFEPIRLPRDNALYIDEEGLFRRPSDQCFFNWSNYPQPLAGKAIVVGIDANGDERDTDYTVEICEEMVRWRGHLKVEGV